MIKIARHVRRDTLAWALLGAFATTAAASDTDVCFKDVAGLDAIEAQIAACTTVIDAGESETLAQAHFKRGGAHYKMKRADDALRDYAEAVKLDPDNGATVYNAMCWTRATLRDGTSELTNALADCNRSMQRKAGANVYDSRGLVYLKMGRYAEALKDYEMALKYNTKSASSIYGRGVAKGKLGDEDDSADDIKAAKAIDMRVDQKYASYGIKP